MAPSLINTFIRKLMERRMKISKDDSTLFPILKIIGSISIE